MDTLTGLNVPFELFRCSNIPECKKRPYMVIEATDSTHKAPTTYEGALLSSVELESGGGAVRSVSFTATQAELGTKTFRWYPQTHKPEIGERVVISVGFIWSEQSQRVRMAEGMLKELKARLPGAAEWRDIDYQEWLETTLPLPKGELAVGTERVQRDLRRS